MRIIHKILSILIIVLIVAILLLGIVGFIGFKYVNNKLDKINYEEIPEEQIEVNEGVELQEKGYRNIAILGVDSRADAYSNTRSDCIIIAAINQETKDIKLVSVYRDSYLNIEGRGLDKVTHAFAFGGPQLSINTLNKNLDLDIKEYVAVNFDAVVETINQIGGVEMTIEPAELKYINGYINEIDRVEGTTTQRVTSTGKQTLNGVQALAYSRIRYTEGGDYRRTERMRDVLSATFNKAKNLSPAQANSLLNNILPKVSTNIKKEEMQSLLPKITTYNVNTSIGWPYEVKGITLDRWYGVPVTLEENVLRLHREIYEETDYEVSQTVKDISQSIIKKTGYK